MHFNKGCFLWLGIRVQQYSKDATHIVGIEDLCIIAIMFQGLIVKWLEVGALFVPHWIVAELPTIAIAWTDTN